MLPNRSLSSEIFIVYSVRFSFCELTIFSGAFSTNDLFDNFSSTFTSSRLSLSISFCNLLTSRFLSILTLSKNFYITDHLERYMIHVWRKIFYNTNHTEFS